MRPLAREPRLQITQLRDFDLQLAFEAARTLRKDVEDELAPIDYPQVEFVLEIAGLSRTERIVEDRQGCTALARQRARLGRLAASDEGARIDLLQPLADGARDGCAGALRQRLQLLERVIGMDSVCVVEFDADQDDALAIIGVGIMRQVQSVPRCNCS
jgi:hypothetical protein